MRKFDFEDDVEEARGLAAVDPADLAEVLKERAQRNRRRRCRGPQRAPGGPEPEGGPSGSTARARDAS